MSRTDHHQPHWVTAELWEPAHYRCPNATEGWWNVRFRDRECTLPPAPVREHPSGWRRTWRSSVGSSCHWEPDWTGVSPWTRPQRWFVEHVWHNPERRRLRDELRAAAAEYRATGDVTDDPAPRQARHCAAWMWS